MLCTSLLMRPQPPFGGNPQEGWGICLELRQALSYIGTFLNQIRGRLLNAINRQLGETVTTSPLAVKPLAV